MILFSASVALYCALSAVAAVDIPLPLITIDPLSDEFIEYINLKQDLWTAGRNFPRDISLAQIEKLMGSRLNESSNELEDKWHETEVIDSLPDSFDSRQKWPQCKSLNEIRDQGGCGGCWAFGAVEAMTDRYCIFSNGSKNFHFSAEDLLSCCEECGGGCLTGVPAFAWKFWKENGIVSGGGYHSHQGCRPYEIPPLHNGTNRSDIPTPPCVRTCQKGYNTRYEYDKHFGKSVYTIWGGESQMKAEIFMNGPVETTFVVYEDFMHYRSGVYRHTAGKDIAGHAVKILGWGIEKGTKYWLVANSWGKKWGDEGFFKILRGENECGIETYINAGVPLLKPRIMTA